MHNFLLFYAPLLIVVLSIALSFVVVLKSKKVEE